MNTGQRAGHSCVTCLFSHLQGAETSIYLASSPEVEGVSSKYYDNCRPVSSNAESYDADVARRLWEASAELTGVSA